MLVARHLVGLLAVALLLAAGVVPAMADASDHAALLEMLEEVSKAPSSPTICDGYVSRSSSAADGLASFSCSSGYSRNHIHGVLIAIRLQLRVGNVLLHRHGCAEQAKSCLMNARDILVNTPPDCMSGRESFAAVAALNESVNQAAGLTDGVPAAATDLYPPPSGEANHCATESPDLAQLYNTAKNWLNANVVSAPNRAKQGGTAFCVPSDPEGIWRADVVIKQGNTVVGSELVRCDINAGTCSQ